MHVVIFGLTISSSWGNGHATLWRSLVKAMLRRGHRVTFYEKDVPYYAAERDLTALPAGGELVLYQAFDRNYGPGAARSRRGGRGAFDELLSGRAGGLRADSGEPGGGEGILRSGYAGDAGRLARGRARWRTCRRTGWPRSTWC